MTGSGVRGPRAILVVVFPVRRGRTTREFQRTRHGVSEVDAVALDWWSGESAADSCGGVPRSGWGDAAAMTGSGVRGPRPLLVVVFPVRGGRTTREFEVAA
jgi:hypothetical protein